MPTKLSWTDDADEPVTSLTFASFAPGSPSAWQDLRLWNDRLSEGADDARSVRLSAMAKPRGASVPYEATGVPVLTYHAIEVEIVGAGIVALGTSSEIVVPDIAAGEFVAVRVRVRAPAGFSLAAADVLLRLSDDPYEELGNAAPSPGGIDLGQSFSQLFEGGAVTETSSPSTSVTVAAGAAQVGGRIRGWATQDLVLGSLDGDGDALASGEAYGALVVETLDGPAVVKGIKVTGSPAPGDFPLAPLGAVPLASAIQGFGVNVENADITDLRVMGGFAVAATGGLGLSAGKGIAIVGTRRVRADVATSFTAEASVTGAVLWLDERRQLVATDGSALVPGEPLLRYSTDATTVTATEDLRRVAGPWLRGSAMLPGLVADEVAPIALPPGGIEICPLSGVVVSVGDDPATLANTSVDWEIEIEAFIAGTWTTIYADGAPTIAFDAALPWTAPTPQLLHFEAPMLRARVVSVPTGGDLAPIAVSVLYRAAYAG